LIADVPVGVFLSSGLDSTALTALAAEQGGDLKTVTLGFEEFKGRPNDETPLAEEVAGIYGTNHQTRWISRRYFEENLEGIFSSMDQPSIDGLNTYFVSRVAQQSGLKVALSGLGGDELFGGYPSFRQIPSLVKLLRPVPFVKAFGRGFRVVSAPVLKRWTSTKYAGLLEYGGGFAGAYMLRRGLFMPWELPGMLDGDLVRSGWQQLAPIATIERDIAGIPSAHSTISCLESCWYMRNQLLRDADWAGMAHSLEIRVPLVDIDLLRATRTHGNGTPLEKRNLFEAPKRPLPETLRSRPKTGFSVPLREWLLARDASNNGRGLRSWARVVFERFSAH